MTSVEIQCTHCIGIGWLTPPGTWVLCSVCDGIGRTWAPGAPGYGCKITLKQRFVGEIVTLGNWERGRILWHAPKKNPTMTYLAVIDDFTEEQSHSPTGYPSVVGVRSVASPRFFTGDDGTGSRQTDQIDPMQRGRRGMLT
jgi:hypothetical protein